MNRIMRNSGAALAAIFIAGSLTACGPGSASSSRSDTNPTEVSTDLGNKKYELTLWDGGLRMFFWTVRRPVQDFCGIARGSSSPVTS